MGLDNLQEKRRYGVEIDEGLNSLFALLNERSTSLDMVSGVALRGTTEFLEMLASNLLRWRLSLTRNASRTIAAKNSRTIR